MACLINLLNNGVNGVYGVDGVNGVFDNLPISRRFSLNIISLQPTLYEKRTRTPYDFISKAKIHA